MLTSKQDISNYFEANRERCKRTLELFSIFANETRFKILCVLRERDFCVKDIIEIIGANPSNVSQQLKMLFLGGYVTKERHGKSIVYHLENSSVRDAIDYCQTSLFNDQEST